MGTSSFADAILKALIKEKYNLVGVYTQTDKKVGRDQGLQKTAVRMTAEAEKIPVFTPSVFDGEALNQLEGLKPDLIIVAAYGKILPQAILELPGFGAINVHTSLLPKYRGPSPIQNAILEGEEETGATIMLMDAGVDTGAILSQQKLAIDPDETAQQLSPRLAELSAQLLLETVPLWVERKINPREQDHRLATLCQLIERDDGRVIWMDEAKEIYDRYRAFQPWPGIFSYWQKNGNNLRLKLNRIALGAQLKNDGYSLGEVFKAGDRIAVQTGSGAVFLEEVQLEGKSTMRIKDFINGNPGFIGSVLK